MVFVLHWSAEHPSASGSPLVPAAAAPATLPAAAPGAPGGASARATPEAKAAPRAARKAVQRALLAARVQSELARCVDGDVGFGVGETGALAPRGRHAILTLELVARVGGLGIDAVTVKAWGGASERTVSCASNVLRGRVVALPASEPGGRLRMEFPLNPRSGEADLVHASSTR